LSNLTDTPPLSLRERKKQRTRATIQAHALRLFRERGYDNTTVEMISEAAEVGPATFYRHFPSKADVVLWDEFDPLIVAAFQAQPPDLPALGALRAAFRTAFEQMTPQQRQEMQQRSQLTLDVPELRAAMTDQYTQAVGLVAEIAAARTGKQTTDLEVLTLAGAVIGVSMAVMHALADKPGADIPQLLDRALAQLESGLAL
jgi:AcrR family transcriptional regulator